ncbi:MAG: rhodanese-like domain-containing protein [Candidatus Krumholzibacteriia bacterium]
MARRTTMDSGGRGRSPLAEAAWLTLVSLVLAAGSWVLHPDPLPLRAEPAVYRLELAAPLVDAAAALAFYETGTHLFIDTRPVGGSEFRTIPGAVSIRQDSFDDDLFALFDFMFPEDPLVVFGDGNLTGPSNIAGRLKDRGYLDIVILQGGLDAWADAGGDLTTRTQGEGGS